MITLKVLSIDDSTTITTHLNYLLKDLNEVDWIGHAYDFCEAKELLKNSKPDVVLLDIMVKEESGFELLGYIKKHFPEVRVFMLSNLNEKIYKVKSKQLGACHYIDKSYEFETIPGLLLEAFNAKGRLN